MKKLFFLISACFLLPIIAFGQHDGLERDYILYVPATFNPNASAPLVLNFHGYTSSANAQMLYGDFRPIADTAGFLIVHPQGTIDILGNTHWNVGWGTSSIDDIGFTSALIDSLSSDYNIDSERVYSTGMSNGGFMSYTLACELSYRIAAVASVTGSMTLNQPNTCDPLHPMPVMEIHGTADDVVSYNGSVLFESIDNVLDYWSDFNNCNPDPIITDMPDIEPNDNSTVEHHLYENGDNGIEVEHFKVINGGHKWPGSIIGGSGTNYDIDASVEVWRFFSRYDINGLIITTGTDQFSENDPSVSIYPNPASSYVTIESESVLHANYRLTTISGQIILFGSINSNKHQLDIRGLSGGMYFLEIGNKTHKIFKSY